MPHTIMAVVISYGIGQYFTNSFTDMILQQKQMPYLPLLLRKKIYERTLSQIKQVSDDFLTTKSTLKDILEILYKEEINKSSFIPVVKSKSKK